MVSIKAHLLVPAVLVNLCLDPNLVKIKCRNQIIFLKISTECRPNWLIALILYLLNYTPGGGTAI